MSKWLSRSYIGLVLTFLYAPIFVLILYSFNQSKSRGHWTGFSLRWYEKLFHNDAILNAFMTTLLVAVIASVIATVLGTAAAIGIHNMRKRSRTAIMNITYLPVINPEIVMGVSLMLLFVLMGIKFGLITLILAHITFNLPYVILSVMPKLRQMDHYLFEAAMDLGCTPLQAFMKVTLPEIMPGIVTGFLMAFTFSLDDFNISYFVSGDKFQTLPILIYSMTRKRVSPEINALSAIIFIVVLLVLILVNINDVRREKELRKKEDALR
ncbi:ABC transporter permease [Anaerovorax sp. IOR16]|uniref:ABC transporter permease n=1 Tax=Anaerovorax sp. IOR16 TaxID=2773458 RepID=UPI0019D31446|nr:ABC transporter permease [Anaerovorax sp. IOR16]